MSSQVRANPAQLVTVERVDVPRISLQSVNLAQLAAGTAAEPLPAQPTTQSYVWLACSRACFAANTAFIQTWLTQITGRGLAELHISDLQNPQIPSHCDTSSHYDLLLFQRLIQRPPTPSEITAAPPNTQKHARTLRLSLDTQAVGFAVFDHVLLSVHPDGCSVLRAYTERLIAAASTTPHAPDMRSVGARGMPHSPADMMLRLVSHMVDAYLDLRRDMSLQMTHWQNELIRPRGRFANWAALLHARNTLHQLETLCDDQRTALQDWLAALSTWGAQSGLDTMETQSGLNTMRTQSSLNTMGPQSGPSPYELELLSIRGRDVIEHIERVVQHTRRLEHTTETAVQMHFNVQGSRTNDSMRTLTAITAIFLPMNLIAAIFGMNFEFMPWLHRSGGFWWTLAAMALLAVVLGLLFWRKHYLSRLEP